MPNDRFLYVESDQIPLTEVPYGDLKENMIDVTTGKPYKGIVLEGVFADLNQTTNNNDRIYDIPSYLEMLQQLKKAIHSAKGVYGELEHPQRYQINYNFVSHKLLDVWYEEETKLVKGRLILLNTEQGKRAAQIIKSGGQLAISARAGGEEVNGPNGVKYAKVQAIFTYDLVYHPGFATAVLEFKELNESQKFIQSSGTSKKGFNFILKQKEIDNLSEAYMDYLKIDNLSESEKTQRRSVCFLEYYNNNRLKNLFESEQQKQQQQILQQNKSVDEKEKENELTRSVEKELSESEKFYQQIKKKQARTVFDNSAGFINFEPTSAQVGYVDSYEI